MENIRTTGIDDLDSQARLRDALEKARVQIEPDVCAHRFVKALLLARVGSTKMKYMTMAVTPE